MFAVSAAVFAVSALVFAGYSRMFAGLGIDFVEPWYLHTFDVNGFQPIG